MTKHAAEGKGYTALWKRIEEVMRAMGWTEADLRREMDLDPQDIYNFKNRNTTIGQERAIRLQKKTKFFAEWINYGRGPKRVFELSRKEQEIVDALRQQPSKLDAVAVLLGLRP